MSTKEFWGITGMLGAFMALFLVSHISPYAFPLSVKSFAADLSYIDGRPIVLTQATTSPGDTASTGQAAYSITWKLSGNSNIGIAADLDFTPASGTSANGTVYDWTNPNGAAWDHGGTNGCDLEAPVVTVTPPSQNLGNWLFSDEGGGLCENGSNAIGNFSVSSAITITCQQSLSVTVTTYNNDHSSTTACDSSHPFTYTSVFDQNLGTIDEDVSITVSAPTCKWVADNTNWTPACSSTVKTQNEGWMLSPSTCSESQAPTKPTGYAGTRNCPTTAGCTNPDGTTKQCGPDGAGGSCGTCSAPGSTCVSGTCQCPSGYAEDPTTKLCVVKCTTAASCGTNHNYGSNTICNADKTVVVQPQVQYTCINGFCGTVSPNPEITVEYCLPGDSCVWSGISGSDAYCSCKSNWQTGEWGACQNIQPAPANNPLQALLQGTETRTVTDANNCPSSITNIYSKPPTSQICYVTNTGNDCSTPTCSLGNCVAKSTAFSFQNFFADISRAFGLTAAAATGTQTKTCTYPPSCGKSPVVTQQDCMLSTTSYSYYCSGNTCVYGNAPSGAKTCSGTSDSTTCAAPQYYCSNAVCVYGTVPSGAKTCNGTSDMTSCGPQCPSCPSPKATGVPKCNGSYLTQYGQLQKCDSSTNYLCVPTTSTDPFSGDVSSGPVTMSSTKCQYGCNSTVTPNACNQCQWVIGKWSTCTPTSTFQVRTVNPSYPGCKPSDGPPPKQQTCPTSTTKSYCQQGSCVQLVKAPNNPITCDPKTAVANGTCIRYNCLSTNGDPADGTCSSDPAPFNISNNIMGEYNTFAGCQAACGSRNVCNKTQCIEKLGSATLAGEIQCAGPGHDTPCKGNVSTTANSPTSSTPQTSGSPTLDAETPQDLNQQTQVTTGDVTSQITSTVKQAITDNVITPLTSLFTIDTTQLTGLAQSTMDQVNNINAKMLTAITPITNAATQAAQSTIQNGINIGNGIAKDLGLLPS